MPNIVVKVISPSALRGVGELGAFDTAAYERKCLAQGDSWFSIGHLPPWCTSSLPEQMLASRSMLAVNCAQPGEVLAHMADTTYHVEFLNLLRGALDFEWDAILLSGGGNDLIDALQAPPTAPLGARLLRSEAEWLPPAAGVTRYVSEAGWAAFGTHMHLVFDIFLAERDRDTTNRGKPVVFHSYDYLTPRNAPAGPRLGPWLLKALRDQYAVPEADWSALSDLLIDRLFVLLGDIVAQRPGMNLRLVDTRGTLVRAQLGSTGVSGDWENEIHPTAHGYAKLAERWRPVLDAL